MARYIPLLLLTALTSAGCGGREYTPAVFRLPRVGDATGTNLKIGDKFPILTGADLDGNEVVLDESTRGDNYTLVIFWSTWCGWCMHDLPHEIELYHLYKDEGLQVIGVNADESLEQARVAAEQNRVPWVNLYEGKDHKISDQLGISSWPEIFLIDKQGTIVSSAEYLRRHGLVRVNDQGDTRNVHHLDWTLLNLLRGGDGKTLFPPDSIQNDQ